MRIFKIFLIVLYDNDMNSLFMRVPFNDYHSTIVRTKYKYILTTNYDTLLEEAARKQGFRDLMKRVYGYKELDKISEAIYTEEPAIIHMHGIATDILLEEFVLTADDYKKIKDKNPGFRSLLNSLFMSYSFLMVGYGGSDPHLEDVINDINLSLQWDYSNLSLPTYYLVLRNDKVSPIQDHIKNRNRTHIIAVDSYDDVLTLLTHLSNVYPRQSG